MKMSIEQWWNVTDGKTEVLAEKHFPVPLYPPQKFVRSGPGSNPALRGQTPATNRLNRNTALKCRVTKASLLMLWGTYRCLP